MSHKKEYFAPEIHRTSSLTVRKLRCPRRQTHLTPQTSRWSSLAPPLEAGELSLMAKEEKRRYQNFSLLHTKIPLAIKYFRKDIFACCRPKTVKTLSWFHHHQTEKMKMFIRNVLDQNALGESSERDGEQGRHQTPRPPFTFISNTLAAFSPPPALLLAHQLSDAAPSCRAGGFPVTAVCSCCSVSRKPRHRFLSLSSGASLQSPTWARFSRTLDQDERDPDYQIL